MSFKYNIQAWEAVVITAHTGNISQTAQLMNADVPRVSRWISGLEKELGGPLFDRTRRPFPPTDLCLEAYQRALPPKRLLMLAGGHFTPYIEHFDATSQAAADWFVRHLGEGVEQSATVVE